MIVSLLQYYFYVRYVMSVILITHIVILLNLYVIIFLITTYLRKNRIQM